MQSTFDNRFDRLQQKYKTKNVKPRILLVTFSIDVTHTERRTVLLASVYNKWRTPESKNVFFSSSIIITLSRSRRARRARAGTEKSKNVLSQHVCFLNDPGMFP